MYDPDIRQQASALIDLGMSLRAVHKSTGVSRATLRDWLDHPEGLFHSDGCRFTSRVRRPLASGDRWYEYPRYMFTNESRDILGLCGQTLDQLGVSWRFSRRNTISVARREAVARLDDSSGRSSDAGAP
jgi:hypothetical protein